MRDAYAFRGIKKPEAVIQWLKDHPDDLEIPEDIYRYVKSNIQAFLPPREILREILDLKTKASILLLCRLHVTVRKLWNGLKEEDLHKFRKNILATCCRADLWEQTNKKQVVDYYAFLIDVAVDDRNFTERHELTFDVVKEAIHEHIAAFSNFLKHTTMNMSDCINVFDCIIIITQLLPKEEPPGANITKKQYESIQKNLLEIMEWDAKRRKGSKIKIYPRQKPYNFTSFAGRICFLIFSQNITWSAQLELLMIDKLADNQRPTYPNYFFKGEDDFKNQLQKRIQSIHDADMQKARQQVMEFCKQNKLKVPAHLPLTNLDKDSSTLQEIMKLTTPSSKVVLCTILWNCRTNKCTLQSLGLGDGEQAFRESLLDICARVQDYAQNHDHATVVDFYIKIINIVSDDRYFEHKLTHEKITKKLDRLVASFRWILEQRTNYVLPALFSKLIDLPAAEKGIRRITQDLTKEQYKSILEDIRKILEFDEGTAARICYKIFSTNVRHSEELEAAIAYELNIGFTPEYPNNFFKDEGDYDARMQNRQRQQEADDAAEAKKRASAAERVRQQQKEQEEENANQRVERHVKKQAKRNAVSEVGRENAKLQALKEKNEAKKAADERTEKEELDQERRAQERQQFEEEKQKRSEERQKAAITPQFVTLENASKKSLSRALRPGGTSSQDSDAASVATAAASVVNAANARLSGHASQRKNERIPDGYDFEKMLDQLRAVQTKRDTDGDLTVVKEYSTGTLKAHVTETGLHVKTVIWQPRSFTDSELEPPPLKAVTTGS